MEHDHGLRTPTHALDHVPLGADHPAVLVGEDRGPTPIEFLLHGLAACITAGIGNIAAARGITLTSVESPVEGDIDLQGILGLSDTVRNGYQRIRISFDIAGDAPAEKLRQIVEQSRARSAVFDVLTNGVPVEFSINTQCHLSSADSDFLDRNSLSQKERLNMAWKRIALASILTVGLNGAIYAGGPTPPAVPTDIVVPAGHKLILVGHAVGTQNYICAPAATAAGVDWFFIGPQATLFDAFGQQIATHFLSRNPFQNDALHATWQHSRDSSAVWAKKLRGSTDPAYVAPDAIEWLLLEMTGAEVGPSGGRKLATTTLIQRVHTVGGVKPPAAECAASTINTRKFVSYEADYYFYE